MCGAAASMKPQELAHSAWALQQLLEAHSAAQQGQQRRQQDSMQQRQGGQQGGLGLGQAPDSPPAAVAALAHVPCAAHGTASVDLHFMAVAHAIQQVCIGALVL